MKGLPRARGDRPYTSFAGPCSKRAPPRTRGSTLYRNSSGWLAQGSPAHAGIDPHVYWYVSVRYRLPRARGDRPASFAGFSPSPVAPPRTRGSTPTHCYHSRSTKGSPAHAGIDPTLLTHSCTLGGLPRARGDRPKRETRKSEYSSAPPRTRGSTRSDLVSANDARGSPAHAGIDPQLRRIAIHLRWLPRARGDRPLGVMGNLEAPRAPPRTRGSTLFLPCFSRCLAGSPAHAGIDPTPRVSGRSLSGLPRARGDRP